MAFSDDYNAVLCKCGQVGNVPGWHKILHAKMWAAYITRELISTIRTMWVPIVAVTILQVIGDL